MKKILVIALVLMICAPATGAHKWTYGTGTSPELLNQWIQDPVFPADVTIGDDIFVTGYLKAGNGTPSVTLANEKAYIEGTLEVDGAVRFDNAALTLPGVACTLPSADGSNTQQLTTNGSGVLSWAAAGSDTQIQYNDGGAFGGIAGFIWDDTNIEVADDINLAFGTDGNWLIQYDEGVDDQLLFLAAGTACAAITDPMVEFIAGATPAADQQVYWIAISYTGTWTQAVP